MPFITGETQLLGALFSTSFTLDVNNNKQGIVNGFIPHQSASFITQ